MNIVAFVKLELQPGENLEFDGKIIKKSFPKGKDAEEELTVEVPVLYKINNPSKLVKERPTLDLK